MTERSVSGADLWGERLPRRLGLWSAIAVIMGTTIGSGIFRVPAVVAERLPNPWLFGGVWVVGGLLAMAGALVFAELSAMYPRSGGFYVYIREAFGRDAEAGGVRNGEGRQGHAQGAHGGLFQKPPAREEGGLPRARLVICGGH